MKHGLFWAVVVLATVMVTTGVLLAGCGRSTDALPLEFYGPNVGYEEDGSISCVITIPYPLGVALAVDMTSSEPSRIKPETIVLPAGEVYIEFSLEVIDDDIANGDVAVTLTATAPGYASDVLNLTVYDNDS